MFGFLQDASRGRPRPLAASGDDGYAVIDALVALMILSVTVVLGLVALQQTVGVSEAAWEARQAHTLIRHVMNTGPRDLGGAAGEAQGFSWRLETQLTGADRPIPICRRAVSLVAADSGRGYKAATLTPCPEDPKA